MISQVLQFYDSIIPSDTTPIIIAVGGLFTIFAVPPLLGLLLDKVFGPLNKNSNPYHPSRKNTRKRRRKVYYNYDQVLDDLTDEYGNLY